MKNNEFNTKAPERIIDYFAQSKDHETGEKMSYDEIFSEAHLMVLAGTDTTSNSLTWLLYLIMTHQEAEKKIQNELTTANLSQFEEFISYNTCNKSLPYLMAVVKEAMRFLQAGVAAFPRLVPRGGRTIMGHYLPEGTECAVPIFALHRSSNLWKNANEFKPERWLTSSPEDLQHFMPFLRGPRVCIAKE